MQVVVQSMRDAGAGDVEIAEHKGIGHPDTICDALAEGFSVALSRFYLERFGSVLHHNVDKALLRGGASRPRFGGGDVLAPMEIFLAGRATHDARGVVVPVEELAVEGSRAWLREHLHALDPDRHVRVHCLTRPGSPELVDVFLRRADAGGWLANDTSCGAGYAPLSELESVVLATSRRLSELSTSVGGARFGEDVKILGIGRPTGIHLTVACALVDRFVPDLRSYAAAVSILGGEIRSVAASLSRRRIEVAVNAADDVASSNVYLTVTGTSAEAGDDGQVGRGNRVNGLITPYRPMTLEAAAGKNPVAHVGKLYNVAAHRIAARLVESVGAVTYCECHLASRIGTPILDPEIVDVRVRLARGAALDDVADRIREVAHAGVSEIGSLWQRIVRGELRVY